MPDSKEKVAKTLKITEKLKREVSLVSHFVSDVLCYFENNPDGTFLPEFHFREKNFLGYSAELDNSTAWFFDVLHPDDFQCLQKTIRKVLHGASSFGEVRLRDRGGDYHLFRIVGKPVWPNDRNGFVAGGIMALNSSQDNSAPSALPKRETIIDSVLSNYVVIDHTGVIISYSGSASRMLGQGSAGSIEGKSLFSFFRSIPEELENYGGSENYLEVDAQLNLPAAECCWLQLCIFPIEKVAQQEEHNFVVLRDITARKNADLALLESEEKFRALADNSHGVIFILADGRIVYVNSLAKKVTGYETSEMLREDFDFSQLFNAMNPGSWLADLEDELVTSENVQREVSVRRKDGVLCKCLVALKYMPYQGKKAVLGVITDITALQMANDKLDETRKRYWALFEASSDAIFLESADGTILDCNSACENIFGYSRVELLGMNAKDMVPPEYLSTLDKLSAEIERTRTSDRNLCLESLGKRKDGSAFPTEVTVNCVKLSGEECFAVTVRDISIRREIETARQRYEAQLAQLQKIDSLGQVANGLANDFNNLLTGIMGYSDLILRDLPASSSSREKAKRIIDAARKGSEIIQQLMSYTGKMPSLFQKANMGLLIKEMEPVFKQMVGANQSLRFEIATDLPEIKVDPPMIKQALTSIVKNAFEALDASVDGVVTISLAAGQCSFSGSETGYFGPPLQAGSYMAVKVSDNGCGIEPMYLNRIFDPFFSTKFSNRGLGLSSVLGMLRGHRGAVFVKSLPLHGTELSVLLPLYDDSHGKDSDGNVVKASFSSGAALVIDDEESVREIIGVNLREMGYETFVAEDGLKGLELFRQIGQKLNVVVIDLVMPEISGEELVKEIRLLNSRVPLLICTGCLTDCSRAELERLGVSAFIEKPFITQSDLERVFIQMQLKIKTPHRQA